METDKIVPACEINAESKGELSADFTRLKTGVTFGQSEGLANHVGKGRGVSAKFGLKALWQYSVCPASVKELRVQIKLTLKVTGIVPVIPVMYKVEGTSAVTLKDLEPASGFKFWLNEIAELEVNPKNASDEVDVDVFSSNDPTNTSAPEVVSISFNVS